MILRSLTYIFLGAPFAASALTLADFSYANHETFVARFARGEPAPCEALIGGPRGPTAVERDSIEAALRRATMLVGEWRAAAAAETFFAAHRDEFGLIYARLIGVRAEFALPRALQGEVVRAINELRFLETYQGYVATEVEIEKLLESLLAQSARLKHEGEYREPDVARFLFELTVLRGQEALMAFKRPLPPEVYDARRVYRAQRIDILLRRAVRFGRLVQK